MLYVELLLSFISGGSIAGSSKRAGSSKTGTSCCAALKLQVCQKTGLHNLRRRPASHSRVGGPRHKLPSRLTPLTVHAQAKKAVPVPATHHGYPGRLVASSSGPCLGLLSASLVYQWQLCHKTLPTPLGAPGSLT